MPLSGSTDISISIHLVDSPLKWNATKRNYFQNYFVMTDSSFVFKDKWIVFKDNSFVFKDKWIVFKDK